MPQLKFDILSYKNTGLAISASELVERYFFGTAPRTTQGLTLSEDAIRYYIQTAQETVEQFLNIKIQKQLMNEERDFIREEFEAWAYVRVTYLVTKPTALLGFISDIQQVKYPPEWLSAKKTSDGKLYSRQVQLVPGTSAATTNSIVYSGISPHLGFFGARTIPNYWHIQYVTGFDKVPIELVSAISKLAAIPIFAILGDLILGPGINSQSMSIDGLSQSFTSARSGKLSAFGARIELYRESLVNDFKNLSDIYRGIIMMGA